MPAGTVYDLDEWMSHEGEWWIPEPNTGCWLWMRGGSQGYGVVKENYKDTGAHRVAYRLFRGPIPAGLDIDHLCRVRCCVNPWHMEPITHRENILRGMCNAAQNARKTHCPRGHEFTPDNTFRYKDGRRDCRSCMKARGQAQRLRAKEAKGVPLGN